MDRKLGHNPGGKPHKADILNNQGIDSGAVEESEVLGGIVELTGEDQGVQRDVGLHPVAVAEGGHLRKFLFGEVVGTEARIEAGKPEEDRISPVGHSSLEAIPSAGGSQEFGT
jgi:hypothetical protein